MVQAGPIDGPLVILLHGFPEFWYGWRNQIHYLAAGGYRVWVPDQRGYNLSHKPKEIKAYRIDEMAADVIGLIDAASCKRAFLVGHDWGAVVAWWVASKYPERLKRLVVVNAPHGMVFSNYLRHNWSQRLRSWYMIFFQIPLFPEITLQIAGNFIIKRILKESSLSGTFTDSDLGLYEQAWSRKGAISSMINWYRAAFLYSRRPTGNPQITVPTLLIWGAKDIFLSRELARLSIDLCDLGKLIFFEHATHWVQLEEPERFNALLGDFLSE